MTTDRMDLLARAQRLDFPSVFVANRVVRDRDGWLHLVERTATVGDLVEIDRQLSEHEAREAQRQDFERRYAAEADARAMRQRVETGWIRRPPAE